MDVAAIGKRLCELRERCGLTQEQLSQQAQLSPQFISEMERGRKSFSVDSMLRYVHGLGLSPALVFQGDGPPFVGLNRAHAQLSLFKQRVLVDIFIPALAVLLEETPTEPPAGDPLVSRSRPKRPPPEGAV